MTNSIRNCLDGHVYLHPMKYFLAIITLIAMMAQTFHMGIIEADFFINQEKITEELCVNKDKPEVQCAGHCQLKKELDKNNKSHSQEKISELNVFIGESPICIEKPFLDRALLSYNLTDKFTAQDFLRDIFHPPSC